MRVVAPRWTFLQARRSGSTSNRACNAFDLNRFADSPALGSPPSRDCSHRDSGCGLRARAERPAHGKVSTMNVNDAASFASFLDDVPRIASEESMFDRSSDSNGERTASSICQLLK